MTDTMSPPVEVFLNFEFVQIGSKPSPCIQSPIDMTDDMGMIDPTDFEKEAILDVVEGNELLNQLPRVVYI